MSAARCWSERPGSWGKGRSPWLSCPSRRPGTAVKGSPDFRECEFLGKQCVQVRHSHIVARVRVTPIDQRYKQRLEPIDVIPVAQLERGFRGVKRGQVSGGQLACVGSTKLWTATLLILIPPRIALVFPNAFLAQRSRAFP